MIQVFHPSADFATGLVPVLPPAKPRVVDVDDLAVQVELLRRRQLRRPDVRELLVKYAERKGVTR